MSKLLLRHILEITQYKTKLFVRDTGSRIEFYDDIWPISAKLEEFSEDVLNSEVHSISVRGGKLLIVLF